MMGTPELDILKQSSQHTLHTFTLEEAPLGVWAQILSSDVLLPLLAVIILLDSRPLLGQGPHSSLGKGVAPLLCGSCSKTWTDLSAALRRGCP